MSLNWDVSKVRDHEELCFNGEGNKRRLNGVTYSLIHATMAVDLGKISEANVDEWLWRLEFLQAVRKGDWLLEDKGARSFTRDEVITHIGLRTNVCDTTRAAFVNRWVGIVKKDVEATVAFQKRKAEEQLKTA